MAKHTPGGRPPLVPYIVTKPVRPDARPGGTSPCNSRNQGKDQAPPGGEHTESDETIAKLAHLLERLVPRTGLEPEKIEAFERFQRGIPMTMQHVAMVAGLTISGVQAAVNRGLLVRRSLAAIAGFNPDDVKAWLWGEAYGWRSRNRKKGEDQTGRWKA